MATIVEGEATEKAEIVLVGFTSSNVTIQGGDSHIVHDIAGQVFSTTDRVIANLRYKPGDISYKIHDPFTIRALLPYPF